MTTIHTLPTTTVSENSEVVEFTLVRDTTNKITRVMNGKSPATQESFHHTPGIVYHYTNAVANIETGKLQEMPIFGKKGLNTVPSELARASEICLKNTKELAHTEDILMADFTIGDRMESHVLGTPHITCHSLLTGKIRGEDHLIYIVEGSLENPIIGPFTTGGHVAITPEIREIIQNKDAMGPDEFKNAIFGIIKGNMAKEIEEEAGVTLPVEALNYFESDPEDPSKTHLHIARNFSKITRGNEEYVHFFHAHLSEEQIAAIIPDNEDGVMGHVATPLAGVEQILAEGGSIPLYKLNGEPFELHKREKFTSDEAYIQGRNRVSRKDLNKELVEDEPNYIPVSTELVIKNLETLRREVVQNVANVLSYNISNTI